MKLKLLGAAVAAAFLGLSTASFGQAGAGGGGASGQDTARTQSSPAASSGSAISGSTGSTTGSATTGATVTTDCDSMTGSAKARCKREHRSSTGSTTTPSGSAVTKEPAQSGPGTVDRTEPKGKPGGGTSSAGS